MYGELERRAPGISAEDWRAFWISLAANAVLLLAIVIVGRLSK